MEITNEFTYWARVLDLAIDSEELAEFLDSRDELHYLRENFFLPRHPNNPNEDSIYLVGNSLGPQPRLTQPLLNQELKVWSELGHLGHTGHSFGRNWVEAGEELIPSLARLVGSTGNITEVIAMGTLTGNLHQLMCTFYRPTNERYQIIIEDHAFPSDHYAMQSQLEMHGISVNDGLVILKPSKENYIYETEDICDRIRQHGGKVAVILLSAVHYYTGQFMDIAKITKVGHEVGAIVGWDLAHAIGNVPLKLSEWNVDFAIWCSYKYLNASPGGIAGLFVNERHLSAGSDNKFSFLKGWWGHRRENRFAMNNEWEGAEGVKALQLSNPCILAMTALKASLDIFDQVDLEALREKSFKLTTYMRTLLAKVSVEHNKIKVITPEKRTESGAQLSLLIIIDNCNIEEIAKKCHDQGLYLDFRHPNVLRIACTGMFNTFADILKAFRIITNSIHGKDKSVNIK